MLSRTENTTKQVPVDIISVQWLKPVSQGGGLEKLKCSACKKPIGDKHFAVAWAKDEKGKYSMRLCEKCGIKANETTNAPAS